VRRLLDQCRVSSIFRLRATQFFEQIDERFIGMPPHALRPYASRPSATKAGCRRECIAGRKSISCVRYGQIFSQSQNAVGKPWVNCSPNNRTAAKSHVCREVLHARKIVQSLALNYPPNGGPSEAANEVPAAETINRSPPPRRFWLTS
jgi:hypothetical protein